MKKKRFGDCSICSRKNVYLLKNGKCKICNYPIPAHKSKRNLKIIEEFKTNTCEELGKKYGISTSRINHIVLKLEKRLNLSFEEEKRRKFFKGYLKKLLKSPNTQPVTLAKYASITKT